MTMTNFQTNNNYFRCKFSALETVTSSQYFSHIHVRKTISKKTTSRCWSFNKMGKIISLANIPFLYEKILLLTVFLIIHKDAVRHSKMF